MARRTKEEKFESCVLQLKGKKGINPFAICQESIFGKEKIKELRG